MWNVVFRPDFFTLSFSTFGAVILFDVSGTVFGIVGRKHVEIIISWCESFKLFCCFLGFQNDVNLTIIVTVPNEMVIGIML